MKEKISDSKKKEEKLAPRTIGPVDENSSEGREKKIGKSLNEYLNEQGIEAPPVSIKIFYGGHTYIKDAKGLKSLIKECDLFIPEGINWTPEYLEGYRKIASGEAPYSEISVLSEDTSAGSFDKEMLRALYGSGKRVAFVDVSHDSDLIYRLSDEVFQADKKFNAKLFSGVESLENILSDLRDFERTKADLQTTKRDQLMLEELGPKVAEILKDDRDLLKKDELRVLMILGTQHTGLYHELIRKNADKKLISRQFSSELTVFHPSAEVRRRFRFGIPVSDDLLLKDMMETILVGEKPEIFFGPKVDSSDKFARKIRGAVEKFSSDEIRMIYKKIGSKNFAEYLGQALKIKGIIIPTQEK